MLIWQELAKIALLGTDRAAIPAAFEKQFTKYDIDTTAPSNTQILEAAATFGAMRRAGYTLKNLSTTVVNKIKEDTAHQICSPTSSKHLAAILKLEQKSPLKEFLSLLQDHHKLIPPEFLPELLDHCVRSKDLRELLVPALGKKGVWLAQLNPDWQHLQDSPPEINWETAPTANKVQVLEYWRLYDPAEAIDLLQQHWSTLDASAKNRLLKTLATSLSLADEDFLETCLDDKRKEVRQTAAKFLATLEGSELMLRMLARLKGLLHVNRSDVNEFKMDVLPFGELQPLDIRDGLSLKLQWKNHGSDYGIVFYLLQAVPPTYLEKHFNLSKKELLESYIRSDWAELLLQATIEAAAGFEDDQWILFLLFFWADQQHHKRWRNIDISPLLQQLSTDAFHRVTNRLVQRPFNLFEEKNLLIQLLTSTKHPWDAALSKAFVTYLRDAAKDNQNTYWSALQFRAIIKNAAYRCPPKLYDTLCRILPEEKLKWTIWEEDYSGFLKVLKFRQEMVVELERYEV